ncbi:MAG: magnesium chelatase domain-containing protein, partial [Oscillospiraceae bacterium]
ISTYDTYINVVGGLKMIEPAVDMGVLLAVASSFKNAPLDDGIVAIGEVGLTGELRSCNYLENRISEAEKMGFTKCLIPAANAKKLKKFKKIEVCPYLNFPQIIRDIF